MRAHLASQPEVLIYQNTLGALGTNAYLLLDPKRKEAILIDTPEACWSWSQALLKQHACRLSALLLTHGHWDHIVDAQVIQNTGVRLYAHAQDRFLIEHPFCQKLLMPPDLKVPPARIDVVLENFQRLRLLGQEIEVRHVPGHCPGSVLFYFSSLKAAFVGDVIFKENIGRSDLPNGSWELLHQSIKEQVYTLPDTVTLYPGHGPTTTVKDEKLHNPYVKA